MTVTEACSNSVMAMATAFRPSLAERMLDLIVTRVPLYSQHFMLFYYTFSFIDFMKALLKAILFLYGFKEVILYVTYHFSKNELVFELFLTIGVPAVWQG